jgi:hypothetical protein
LCPLCRAAKATYFPGPFRTLVQDARKFGALEMKKIRTEAIQAWFNTLGLPDGGAMYGINFHRRRKGVHSLGQEDWNFYGPDEDSAKNIWIYNVTIHDLANAPNPVPTLAHASGGILHEMTGGVLRMEDITNQEGFLSLRKPATYQGNLHVDAIVAMYKLANDYWAHIVTQNPECENPNINVEDPPFRYETPADSGPDCRPNPIEERKFEKDWGLVHKRFFGGIGLSRGFYKWATVPGTDLSELFNQTSDINERRSGPHRLDCGDTQFHTSKGLFGLKVDFADHVYIKNVKIYNLKNVGDADNFICSNTWSEKDGDLFGPNINKYAGANVRAFVTSKSFNVKLHNVEIDNIYSEKGSAYGVDLLGDRNGRSVGMPKYVGPDKPNVAIRNVVVGRRIKAGTGDLAKPFHVDPLYVDVEGLGLLQPPNLSHKWSPPRVALNLAIDQDVEAEGGLAPPLTPEDAKMLFLAWTNYNEDMLLELRQQAVDYIREHYGITLSADPWVFPDPAQPIIDEEVGNLTLTGRAIESRFFLDTVTFKDKAYPALTANPVHDIYYEFKPKEGLIVQGVYSAGAGVALGPDASIKVGAWVVEAFPLDWNELPGLAGPDFVTPTSAELKLGVDSLLPPPTDPFKPMLSSRMIKYWSSIPSAPFSLRGAEDVVQEHIVATVYDDLYGYGRAVGLQTTYPEKISGFVGIIFDDNHVNGEYPMDQLNWDEMSTGEFTKGGLTFLVVADGKFGIEDPYPNNKPYPSIFKTQEAGIKALKRREFMGFRDQDYLNFLDEFSTFLDNFGVQAGDLSGQVKNRKNAPLQRFLANGFGAPGGGIDFYTATTDNDMRCVSAKLLNGTVKIFDAARVNEVGLLYHVGGGGYMTPSGVFYPAGTFIKKGWYIIEKTGLGTPPDMDVQGYKYTYGPTPEDREPYLFVSFETKVPTALSQYGPSYMVEQLWSKELGYGELQATVVAGVNGFIENTKEWSLELRGSMHFMGTEEAEDLMPPAPEAPSDAPEIDTEAPEIDMELMTASGRRV